MKQVLLYLPVIHKGYEDFLRRHADADEVWVLGASFAEDFPVLRKEIRALDPAAAARYVGATGVLERDDIAREITAELLVVPDEGLMLAVVERFGLDQGRTLLTDRTFLRWDRSWSQAAKLAGYDGTVAIDELSVALMKQEADRSSDWWRQVGAVVVRDGIILDSAHNEHRPTEYSPYVDGDPRNDFSRGVRADLSTAIHAEAALVARAARDGVPLRGADLYVSTFPCPACARLIAEAGFRRCYFAGPYAVLDGDAILRAAGVDLIWVDASPSAAG